MIHSQLCQIATETKNQNLYWLWQILRHHLIYRNSFTQDEAIELGCRYLDLSENRVWLLFREGDRKYWEINTVYRGDNKGENRIFPYTAQQITLKHGVLPAGSTFKFNVKKIQGKSLEERNAMLYKFAVVQKEDRKKRIPISRKSISKRLGITKTTQRRWEKIAKIKSQPNFALVAEAKKKTLSNLKADTADKILENISQSETKESTVNYKECDLSAHKNSKKAKYSYQVIKGVRGVFRQLPNVYHGQVIFATRNQHKKYTLLRVDASNSKAINLSTLQSGSPRKQHEYIFQLKPRKPKKDNCFTFSKGVGFWYIWRHEVCLL